jgi:cyclopropane fatty-acyl-phospholipid synthase-like methyltransferase
MMLARWQFQARFGHKSEAINLLKQWNEQIGAQTDTDVSRSRILTGSVGASEALVEMEIEIDGLDDLQKFFDKIASITMHEDWGKQMSDVVVSGSTRWEVFRII